MSAEYRSFRARADKDVDNVFNRMQRDGVEFSVISINQALGSWVVFYSVEVEEDRRGCGWLGCGHSTCEELCKGVKPEPSTDRLEMVSIRDPRSWTSDPQEIEDYNSRGFFRKIFGHR